MDLIQSQQLLAQLFTDAEFRERLIENPTSVSKRYQMDSADVRWLQQFAGGEGKQFAWTLIRKRLGVVATLLPQTQRVMGKRFGKSFHEFAADRDTYGINRHLTDAVDFARWLMDGQLAEMPNWLPILIRYELTWLEAQNAQGFFFKMIPYRHDMDALVKVSNGEQITYQGRPNLIIWWRWFARSEPHERVIFPRYWPG